MGDSLESGVLRPVLERFGLLAIIILATALRLYRLEDQSIWNDEFAITAQLPAPDLATNFQLIQIIVPEHAISPLYYALQYYWAHYVGISLPVLRLLPITFSVLGVLMLYHIGRYLFGGVAGLVAALCMAMSPQFIWFGQEVRNYPLFYLLTLVASYSLLRAVYDGPLDGQSMANRSWKWWALNIVSNTLLPWTHALAPVFLLVEGLFLLAFVRRAFSRLLVWGVLQGIFLLPWALFVLEMPYSSDHSSGGISFVAVVDNMVGGDVVFRNTDLLPAWKTDATSASSMLQEFLEWRGWLDSGLLLVCGATVIWLFAQAAVHGRRLLRGDRLGEVGATRLGSPIFLALLCAMPACLLGLLEIAFGQVLGAVMYGMYSYIGIYVGVGALVSRLRLPVLKPICVVLLLVLYGYQLRLLLPEVSRTDWRRAAAYVEEHGTPQDSVIDLVCYPTAGHVMEYYLPKSFREKQLVNTFQAACDQAAVFFQRPGVENANVWITLAPLPILWSYVWPEGTSYAELVQMTRSRPQQILEKHLAKRGLRVVFSEFPGQYNVLLGRVSAVATPSNIGEPVPGLVPVDYDGILLDLGLAPENPMERGRMIGALRQQIFRWPEGDKLVYIRHGLYLLRDGQPDIALAMARSRLRIEPGLSIAYLLESLALAYQGDDGAALAAFETGCTFQRRLEPLFGPLLFALCRDHDRAKAWEEVTALSRVDFYWISTVRAVCAKRFPSRTLP